MKDLNTDTTAQMTGDEIDMSVQGTPARVWGIMISGDSTGTMPAGIGNASAIDVRAAGYQGSGLKWHGGVNIEDATTDTAAVNIGTTTTGNGVGSQLLTFHGRDGGGVDKPVSINGTSSGTINLGAAVQKLNIQDKGQCTMAAGTCSAQTLNNTYTAAPICVVTWTGSGTLAGSIKVASSTTTVTPSSSTGTDTAVVNWICVGN